SEVSRLIVRRLWQGIVVAALSATLTFALMLAAPGDPMSAALDHTTIDEATRDQWRAQWALDRSGPERLLAWGLGIVRLDLGPSVATGRPIGESIRAALPYSVLLMGSAIFCSVVLGVAMAVAQA